MDFNDLPDEVKLPIMAAVGGREQHIAALYDGQPVAGSAQPIEQAPTPVTDDFGNTPLSPGQAQHVDHLLAVETDSLAREVLITLKRDGLPPKSEWNDFMTPYALWSWDAESDTRAWATLAAIAESDWDEWLGHADTPGVEGVAQDKGDDLIEGLVIIDAGSGNLVLSKTGVRGPGGQQYLGLLDAEVEALQGLELIFVHNHPNGSDASEEDLDSAFRAGAELLIVITPQGQEFVYVRGRFGMVKVRDEKASYEVGPATLRETRALVARSKAQSRVFLADLPELIFRQDDPGIQIRVTGEVQFADSEAAVVMNEVGSYDKDRFEESLFNVVGISRLKPYAVLVEDEKGKQFWIDLNEYGDTTFEIIGADNLAGIPYAKESGAVLDNPYRQILEGTIDSLPIEEEHIIRVIPFGATGNPDWHSTDGYHIGFDIITPHGTEVQAQFSGEVLGISVPADVDLGDIYGEPYSSVKRTSDPRMPEPEVSVYDTRNESVRGRQNYIDDWLFERSGGGYIVVRGGNFMLFTHTSIQGPFKWGHTLLRARS